MLVQLNNSIFMYLFIYFYCKNQQLTVRSNEDGFSRAMALTSSISSRYQQYSAVQVDCLPATCTTIMNNLIPRMFDWHIIYPFAMSAFTCKHGEGRGNYFYTVCHAD